MGHDPFILRSEHKRVLQSAQERYDAALRNCEQCGFWRGVVFTMTICAVLALMAVVAFLYYMPDPVAPDNICVPMYDVSGYERCQ